MERVQRPRSKQLSDLAGGASKFVCLYDVAEKVMLRRFQISANRSLDGVLDQLNSKRVTDAGPLDLIDDSSDEEDDTQKGGDLSAYAKCYCISFT